MSWKEDFDAGFCEAAQLPSRMIYHMENAVRVSHHKYGPIINKTPQRMKSNATNAMEAYKKDGNAEHLVDYCNFCMFVYILADDINMIEQARRAGTMYRDEAYKGTDSNQSTTVIKQSVFDWLRGDILHGIDS